MNEIEVGEVVIDEELLVGEIELDVIKEVPEFKEKELLITYEDESTEIVKLVISE